MGPISQVRRGRVKERQGLLTGIQKLVGSRPPESCVPLTGPGASYSPQLGHQPMPTPPLQAGASETCSHHPRGGANVKLWESRTGFSTSSLSRFGWIIPCRGVYPRMDHRRMFRRIPGPCPLDASKNLSISSCDDQKCPPNIVQCPLGGEGVPS